MMTLMYTFSGDVHVFGPVVADSDVHVFRTVVVFDIDVHVFRTRVVAEADVHVFSTRVVVLLTLMYTFSGQQL